MPVPSSLSSFLSTQRRVDFARKFPGEWLVWEPGPWKASPRGMIVTQTGPLPSELAPTAPRQGDALCFLLGYGAQRLEVGREPTNDVVISDGTVSRRHLLLEGDAGLWTVRATRPATLQGKGVEGVASLWPGAVLVIGGVTLSFHDTASLLARLGR